MRVTSVKEAKDGISRENGQTYVFVSQAVDYSKPMALEEATGSK